MKAAVILISFLVVVVLCIEVYNNDTFIHGSKRVEFTPDSMYVRHVAWEGLDNGDMLVEFNRPVRMRVMFYDVPFLTAAKWRDSNTKDGFYNAMVRGVYKRSHPENVKGVGFY